MTKKEEPSDEDHGSRPSKLRLAPPRPPQTSDDEEQPRSSSRKVRKKQSGLSLASRLPLSQRNETTEQRDWWPSGWSQGESSAMEDMDSSMHSSIGEHELGPGAHRIIEAHEGLNSDESSSWTPTFVQDGMEVTNEDFENRPLEEQMPPVEGILAPNRDEARANMLNRAVEADDVQVVGQQKKRRRYITFGVVLIALVVAATGASLGVVLGGEGGAGGVSSALGGPTPAPTISPTPIPISQRFVEVASLVQSSFGAVLDDPASPQYRAAEWLADVDTTFDLSDEERFRQRYAAAVFYYSTGGDTSWIQQMNFLTPEVHECDWNEPLGDHALFDYEGFDPVGMLCYDADNPLSIDLIMMVRNNATGSLPNEIGALSNLRFLFLPENELDRVFFSSLFELKGLETFGMPFNTLTGSLPTEIGQLTTLLHLWFEGASFDSTIPSETGNLSNLQLLSLRECSLVGSIPETFLQLSNLGTLALSGNNLTGTLPSSFPSAWPNLYLLSLKNNQFRGSLPQDIGNLSSLEGIDLSNNVFSGPLPQSFGNLPVLSLLVIYNNSITGSLPEEWTGSLFQSSPLRTLVLEENSLTGTLPPSLGSLTALEDLSLGLNRLTGTIPVELGNATQLFLIQLHENDLVGTVPQSFGQLTSLEYLNLHNNRLEGDLSFLCDESEFLFPDMVQLYADCLGEVECPCCNGCCDSDNECYQF